MPPKKGKGEQPKEKKVAVDKVNVAHSPLYMLPLTQIADLWHEKRTSPSKRSNDTYLPSSPPPNPTTLTPLPPQKKGAQAQKTIAQIAQQTSQAQTPEQKRKAAEKAAREKEKAASEQAKKEAAELFKPIQVQKVPFGVDPKTVVCQFFKSGNCEKGKRCKFSHDLDVGRRGAKRSLYTDTRDGEEEGEGGEEEQKKKEEEDMAEWDEAKLRQVVLSKHGNPRATTDKICKFFISAVEEGKYGWFWSCPNGGDKCMYRHSLPPGFILRTKEQRAAEKALMDKSPLNTLTLEDFLEIERGKLVGEGTKVTEETFAEWKAKRLDKRAAEEEARRQKDATGRAMFEAGGWEESEGESESEGSEDGDGDEDGGGEGWNMEEMRRETERLKEDTERRRIEGLGGQVAIEKGGGGKVNGEEGGEGEGEDGAVGLNYISSPNRREAHSHTSSKKVQKPYTRTVP
ncbi:uncharacterized protein KY384_007886 [Bacidia gigantensis]|uniref:uncharacterized protein n=1 Tax=Bacidia gigantensis TaxID=2732470 RepID=UPI001D0406D6|nr:uncharacterized protein KY384_007886 [Bacidia gigantensis]KAG8527732.1 hypothetical protein KY384_007886 [Bacidia gigantensis]